MGSQLVDRLNQLLKQEHACAIRYATHAATITGPYAESIAQRLKEISQDEMLHAEKLRERILALKGIPTLEVHTESLEYADNLKDILAINKAEEQAAINEYTDLLSLIPPTNIILFKTIEEIVRDEQEHLEELDNLEVGTDQAQ